MISDDLSKLLYRYALINATEHKGKAQKGAVMGIFMSSHAEMRKEARKIAEITQEVVDKVNSMDLDVQKDELDKLGYKSSAEDKKDKKKGLADLPQVQGNVVLRFAPNPSGPLHIGHARAALLNQEYVKRYQGKLILRIEDTDPRRVDPAAYKMIEEDLGWLGVEWQEKVIQSDRIPTYYQYAEKLLKMNAAYMCTCEGGEFKKLKDASKPCNCRNLPVEENLRLWNEMEGMSEGEAVLRVKTDLEHKNPAIRDWVAMRIVQKEHPRTGLQFKIYPMMNFSVAVDDHLLGVTHVLRGKDHITNTEKQRYLYNHFGWNIPVFIHYGRLKMEDVPLSTSRAREGIEKGIYSGWDDPRLGTLRAIARRGIKREAIKELITEIGVKIADSTLSWKKLYGLNRNLLEKEANRYFFVGNPCQLSIENLPESAKITVKRQLHPDFPERGYREIPFDGEVYLTGEDVRSGQNKMVRLMDLLNITFEGRNAIFHSFSLKEARDASAPIVQWVPASFNSKAEVVMPDANVLEGFLEPSSRELKVGDVVQFERFGFVRLDNISPGKMRFYFGHK